ncbi:ABC transporter permease [Clostridium perfringens]|uniref:ABC transporter permease n=1 Tax=Clostridium perfringens TaxID=1502 RepID=UPI0030CC286E
MYRIFKLTLKSALKDPFLLFWSIIVPLGGTIGLGIFIKKSNYNIRITVGMIATSIIFYAFLTTAYAILAQRRRGVYNLLKITPLTLTKYIISCSAAWMTISIICGFIVFIPSYIIFKFDFPLIGCFLMIFAMMLASLGYIFYGFIISSLCKNESQLSMISNILLLPLLFCSDAFYSLEKMPELFRKICAINPFQIFITALRSSLDLQYLTFSICILSLLFYAAIGVFFATKTFKYGEAR